MLDPLTKIANRKAFDEQLIEEMNASLQSGKPLSLLVFDIDHFKAFNDTFGHLTGDQVLRLVAQVLKANIRGRDLPARFGGEEFVAILPETDLAGGMNVGETIRAAVQSKELLKRSTNEKLGRITLSVGVAVLRSDDTVATLIERADRCLYAAKGNGRNRVVAEHQLSEENGVIDVA
nr:GGDEF domain-containing protein [Pelagibacterium limicola]